MRLRCLAIAIAIAACAPTVDTIAERQRSVDREDGARLAAQLAALPGVWSASAELRRPVHDGFEPLSSSLGPRTSGLGPQPDQSPDSGGPKPEARGPSAAILLVVDDQADRAAVSSAARQLTLGAAPEIREPQIVVELGAPRPELAQVGPFTVERGSRRALIVTLGIAAAAIAALALALAGYARRGSSTQ